jgi:hypothetical protein
MRKGGVLAGGAANKYISGRKVPRWDTFFSEGIGRGGKGALTVSGDLATLGKVDFGLTLVCAHILDTRNVFTVQRQARSSIAPRTPSVRLTLHYIV